MLLGTSLTYDLYYFIYWFLVPFLFRMLIGVFLIVSGYAITKKREEFKSAYLFCVWGIITIGITSVIYLAPITISWTNFSQVDYDLIVLRNIILVILNLIAVGASLIIVGVRNSGNYRKQLLLAGVLFSIYFFLLYISELIFYTYLLENSVYHFATTIDFSIYIILQNINTIIYVVAFTLFFWFSLKLNDRYMLIASFTFLGYYIIYLSSLIYFLNVYYIGKFIAEMVFLIYFIPRLIIINSPEINPGTELNSARKNQFQFLIIIGLIIFSVGTLFYESFIILYYISYSGLVLSYISLLLFLRYFIKTKFPERNEEFKKLLKNYKWYIIFGLGILIITGAILVFVWYVAFTNVQPLNINYFGIIYFVSIVLMFKILNKKNEEPTTSSTDLDN